MQEQIDTGRMPPSAARHSPYAHLLTQCLGLEDAPDPQVMSGRAESGDAFLLCTDGLVGMLDDDAMMADAPLGSSSRDRERSAGPALRSTRSSRPANDAGGHDNITAALIRFD